MADLKDTFIEQVKAHERMIFKVCFMYAHNADDKQDLYQEIMVQLWNAYPRFRGEAKFGTWLYQIAINTAIAGFRKGKRTVQYESLDPSLTETGDSSSAQEEQERLDLLYKAIGHLNEIERAIVMLYLEDKTYEEMEDILGISNGALRVKMHRIKDKLRQLTKQE